MVRDNTETQTIDLTLNSFDEEGNVVDTTSQSIRTDQASDIIDHAASLVLSTDSDQGSVDSVVLGELREALESAGVV